MDSQAWRAVIYHHAKMGKTPTQTTEILHKIHGENAPHKSTVCKWHNEYKWGRKDLATRKSTGRPSEAITERKKVAALNLITKYPRISARVLAQQLNIDDHTVKILLNHHLGMAKLLAIWVPNTLTAAQKLARVDNAKEILKVWGNRWSNFCSRLLTVDETWVSYNTALSRRGAAEWRPIGSQPPQLPRRAYDNRKLMAVVFWDMEGVVHCEFFKSTPAQPGLNSKLYLAMIERLYTSLQEKRPQLLRRGVLFLQDNATPHKAKVVLEKLEQFKFKIIAHPPNSPDVAPSDYHLFPALKNNLAGSKLLDREQVECRVLQFFESKPSEFYKRGVEKLREKLSAVVERDGEYLLE